MDLSAFYQVRLFGKLHLILSKWNYSSMVSEYSDLVKMCMWCWPCLYICCLYPIIGIPNCLIWWHYSRSHFNQKISVLCFEHVLFLSIDRNKPMNMAIKCICMYTVFFKKKIRWMNLILFVVAIVLEISQERAKKLVRFNLLCLEVYRKLNYKE